MNKAQKENDVSKVLCQVEDARSCERIKNGICCFLNKCRVCEKTKEQLDYILSRIDAHTYLEACAGSGKTEALGMKTAYEITRWDKTSSGIAVLTFTNEAANTIKRRVSMFYPHEIPSVHYIGTYAGFVHGYLAQKFGYAFFQKNTQEQDKSFRIIDKNSKVYDNAWINNYKLEFPIPKNQIFANQLSFQLSDKKWYIYFGENSNQEASNFYMSDGMQEYINKIRREKGKDFLFGYRFFLEKIVECKTKFWEDRFATFEDMSFIALNCLENESIALAISKKFPLIMIDECQDLSYIELEILKKIRGAGSVVHYIGDLNQAIYSFKDARPEYFVNLILKDETKTLRLNDNFRSCQKIVDVACALQNIKLGIMGREKDICGTNAAIYYEYETEQESVNVFVEMLRRYSIEISDAIVLVRNLSLKNKLETGTSIDYEQHAVLNAVQLWGIEGQESKRQAMYLIGQQIQKWLKSRGRRDHYYCPEDYDDILCWRLMLRDILNEFVASEIVSAYVDKTYSEWYHAAKGTILEIISRHLQKAIGKERAILDGATMRTPSGTSSLPIQRIMNNACARPRIDTIHSVKGCSFRAVMLVSSSDGRGKTGYWENWIDEKDETTRFGYVASTRPMHMLIWAVPSLTNEQRIKIESIGLRNLSRG